jgi:putative transposase
VVMCDHIERPHIWKQAIRSKLSEKCLQVGAVHIWTYNNERPNMGIGGITPAQKLKMAA